MKRDFFHSGVPLFGGSAGIAAQALSFLIIFVNYEATPRRRCRPDPA
jgi:hypothetical protein